MTEPREQRLIEAASRGDPGAARRLYERYAPRVFAVVRRITGEDDLAHDCAQEVWIRAFRSLPTFRGDARFSTWIHRIAVNTALQETRSHGRRGERESPISESLPAPAPEQDPLLAQRLEEALDRVPPGMRQILVLHDVEEYTHEEIAELLGISSGTSKSQLFKARARMRRILRSSSGEPHHDESTGFGGMRA
jgi:RNA polymerase sigma-70 factor, ECF subfamily